MCIFMRFSLNAEGVRMFISFENKTLLSDLLFLKFDCEKMIFCNIKLLGGSSLVYFCEVQFAY